jgi:hypothetical protein
VARRGEEMRGEGGREGQGRRLATGREKKRPRPPECVEARRRRTLRGRENNALCVFVVVQMRRGDATIRESIKERRRGRRVAQDSLTGISLTLACSDSLVLPSAQAHEL